MLEWQKITLSGLSAIICLIVPTSARSFEFEKFGFVDITGKEIIAPQYGVTQKFQHPSSQSDRPYSDSYCQ
ncbi:hypothetical protein BH10CYA1_BH10CYA1_03130 [soil metagenome]